VHTSPKAEWPDSEPGAIPLGIQIDNVAGGAGGKGGKSTGALYQNSTGEERGGKGGKGGIARIGNTENSRIKIGSFKGGAGGEGGEGYVPGAGGIGGEANIGAEKEILGSELQPGDEMSIKDFGVKFGLSEKVVQMLDDYGYEIAGSLRYAQIKDLKAAGLRPGHIAGLQHALDLWSSANNA